MKVRYSPPLQGVVAKVKDLFSGKETDGGDADRLVYDVDDQGHRLYKEDIIQNILSELDRRRTERSAIFPRW